MAYDKDKLFEAALKAIDDNKLCFIEEVVAYVGCSKTTFYDYFKIDSNEMDTLKEAIQKNRVHTKVKMRKKWEDSENATLQVALMKLIATNEEAHRLNGSKQEIDHTSKGDKLGVQIYLPDNGRDKTD